MIDLHRMSHVSFDDATSRRRQERERIKRLLRSAANSIAMMTHEPGKVISSDNELVDDQRFIEGVEIGMRLGVSCVEPLVPAQRGDDWISTCDLLRRYHRRFKRQLDEQARAELFNLLGR